MNAPNMDLEHTSYWRFPVNNNVFRIVQPFLRSSTTRWAALLPTASNPATNIRINVNQANVNQANVNQTWELRASAKTCRSSSPSATDSTLRDPRPPALAAGTSPTSPKPHSGHRAC